MAAAVAALLAVHTAGANSSPAASIPAGADASGGAHQHHHQHQQQQQQHKQVAVRQASSPLQQVAHGSQQAGAQSQELQVQHPQQQLPAATTPAAQSHQLGFVLPALGLVEQQVIAAIGPPRNYDSFPPGFGPRGVGQQGSTVDPAAAQTGGQPATLANTLAADSAAAIPSSATPRGAVPQGSAAATAAVVSSPRCDCPQQQTQLQQDAQVVEGLIAAHMAQLEAAAEVSSHTVTGVRLVITTGY